MVSDVRLIFVLNPRKTSRIFYAVLVLMAAYAKVKEGVRISYTAQLLGYGVMVSTVDSKSICSGSNPDTPTMTFKYNGKIISTPNLEKKLKRMKISIDDIEIIDDIPKKKEEFGIEDYMLDKEQVTIKCKLDTIQRVCYVPKGIRPPIKEFLNKHNLYSEEQLNNMYYDE